jgi:1-phosphofructokinase family hexose kinase
MIVTLTANPSIDRTVQLEQPLERGSVLRAHSTRSDPGGKGVNVARVLAAADLDVLAVLPGIGGDPLLSALAAGGIPHIGVATTGLARTNITIAEPDGTTTKINEPGATLSGSTLDALAQELIARADTALWFALSGSLPPGVPLGWYGELVAALRDHPCKVAVDTSDAPLTALAEGFPDSAPDLLKPNGEELAQLTGVDGHVLERAAENGDRGPAITAIGRSRRRQCARHARRSRCCPRHGRRRVDRHRSPDCRSQYRRRRRFVAGRLHPRRSGRRLGIRAATSRGRLRKRRCLPSRHNPSHARTDRSGSGFGICSRCRLSHPRPHRTRLTP